MTERMKNRMRTILTPKEISPDQQDPVADVVDRSHEFVGVLGGRDRPADNGRRSEAADLVDALIDVGRHPGLTGEHQPGNLFHALKVPGGYLQDIFRRRMNHEKTLLVNRPAVTGFADLEAGDQLGQEIGFQHSDHGSLEIAARPLDGRADGHDRLAGPPGDNRVAHIGPAGQGLLEIAPVLDVHPEILTVQTVGDRFPFRSGDHQGFVV